ncbi:PEP-CTERM sorting domain-containing protein [Rhodoferax saidenbachensis]|uniref:Ice-binding protein C-terminal domain-containing protein n=1 Tax=Rhodoferax saidenbachensis TaxID=1484693 RepID=A0ABU1ZJC3_9BURK|nr:PEP-CTERM sorting domain-containing protein [Rhodoferax saidenbachensis]MDR7305638.1 hypothetical protein [Rhodoferax saidenbachensis]
MKTAIKALEACIGLATLLAGGQAVASTVSFEDLSSPLAATSTTLVSTGYQFSTTDLHGIFDASGFGASNGTHFLVYRSSGAGTESFAAVSGTAFNVNSIDLGGWHNFGPNPLSIEITGYRTSGLNVTNTISVAPGVFTSFALTGFTNLASVRLGSFAGAYVAVDNINVSPVPEPETLAMLLAGLGLVGWTVRRRIPQS